jgi:lipoprotein-anchoring transpeptidase ErfK/SrfK
MKTFYTILLLVFVSMQSNAQADTANSGYIFVGHPDRLSALDGLLTNAPYYGLKKLDYQDDYKKALNSGDHADSLLLTIANRFFSHIANGNTVPNLQYAGAKFNLNVIDVPSLVNSYAKQNNLSALITYFTNDAKEVSIILDSLHFYQNVSNYDKDKVQLLEKAANEFRWLTAIKKSNKIVLVNIPAAHLNAYDSNKLVLNMRVVVGKSWTQTTTLSSQVTKVVLNPYWHVPSSIIRNEMIPKFKNDKAYFSKHGYTVLDGTGKAVDLSTADASTYSESNFPFSIRQHTGASNSLGLLKVEFNSPSAIYLHDSPDKKLFKNESRFYSHGCVRLERPVDLGKWLLQNNSKEIDSFDFKNPGKYSKPQYINVTIPTQVIIWYSLVDFDNEGTLKFYKNIYRKK